MYRYSEAARILHQALVKFPDSRTMWRGRQSDQKLLQNDDVSSYGMAVLLHTMDWHHWETKRHIGNKFSLLNAKQMLDPLIEPMTFNGTIGQYPREPSFRPYKVGFDLVELIAFLDRNEIKHDLTLQDETELPVDDDIAVSQYDPSPINMKTIHYNSSGVEYSGLLKIPRHPDDWFDAIDAMTLAYREQYQTMPNATQAWGNLSLTPPHGYNITIQEGCKNKNCLEMPGFSHLTKKSFDNRWKRYTIRHNKTQ